LRIIARRTLREYWLSHADCEDALKTWYAVVRKAKWQNILDVRQTYSSAEMVGKYTVVNIKGNHYRLVACIDYRLRIVFVSAVLTHAEYSKDRWKHK
jgi:mRNA interferase HigB